MEEVQEKNKMAVTMDLGDPGGLNRSMLFLKLLAPKKPYHLKLSKLSPADSSPCHGVRRMRLHRCSSICTRCKLGAASGARGTREP